MKVSQSSRRNGRQQARLAASISVLLAFMHVEAKLLGLKDSLFFFNDVFWDHLLIRSRAAELARVEEIERQGSRRIPCKAECALNPAEIVLVAKPSSVLHTVLDVLFSCL